MSRIGVVGAAGYVGRFLCRRLIREGARVVAIARANGSFLLDDMDLTVVHPDYASSVGELDGVVNLAHPGPVFPWQYRRYDRAIIALVRELAGEKARIVHASSIAVFGYGLDTVVTATPVSRRRDYAYVESKIFQESALRAAFEGRDLQIVRLGNVWGPASPSWTAALAARLMFGDPVGVAGADGYSNVTDVENAASYLAHLALRPGTRAGAFHHLAELGANRWSYWIDRMALHLRVRPVRAAAQPAYPLALGAELRSWIAAHGPMAAAKGALRSRFIESWMRSVLARLPQQAVDRLERRAHAAGGSGSRDDSLLTILSTPRQFVSVQDPAWQPPVGAELSWERVRAWLDEAGYGDST